MSFVIDRFEGEFAVVVSDNGETYNIHRALLPEDAEENYVINLTVDREETENRRKRIKNLMNRLFDESEG